jgi:glucose-1-phosphate cytidylyltransferase
VIILCGGRGTRLQEHTRAIPKPLVEIGGRPILWHVISLYVAQGFEEFLLLTGYKGELIEAFAQGEAWPAGVTVRCVDTGLNTPTGGRLAVARGRSASAGSAPRTPTASPTSTWPRFWSSTCATARSRQ